MTDNDNWRKVAGNLHQGLTEALRDKQRMLVLIGNAVAAYRRGGGWMSSADYHGDECICLRCSMQRLEALLTDKKNASDEPRVAELEAANRGLVRLNEATEARAKAAEAKNAKAMKALGDLLEAHESGWPDGQDWGAWDIARATLAEIGEGHE